MRPPQIAKRNRHRTGLVPTHELVESLVEASTREEHQLVVVTVGKARLCRARGGYKAKRSGSVRHNIDNASARDWFGGK